MRIVGEIMYIRIGFIICRPTVATIEQFEFQLGGLQAHMLIAGLHPRSASSHRFAWQHSARVSQILRSAYLSHMIAAAT